ncbi:hypothetical protein OG978_33425 [Streptomyces sp. NBC_01591]|uniref:hypothetical protein n=1 Tax=Streptomyces sp. NBC_01591 TaxID=2975888 RepID=UPI002DDC4EF5|nr:hypothetical protein [Streptomyces sp. NBC_01591]WSD71865.1 hypothetical protein OG978_33425 [Streptomyces sp. NBC_01591]
MDRPITHSFADDTTHSLAVLGQTHQELCTENLAPSANGMLLHTCHRVEWYAVGNSDSPVRILENRLRTTGRHEALTRLAQIAAGTRSMILGERFVQRQVHEAANRLGPDHPLSQLAADALLLAERARQEFDLYAKVDYSDLPQLLLGRHSDNEARKLLIVGGGMLARAIAAAPPSGYDRVVMMTRGPRKLRRMMDGLDTVTVVRSPSLARALDGQPHDTVIATTNLPADYQSQVVDATRSPLSRGVVDLCCVPVLDERPLGYRHLYDPDVLHTLKAANRDMTERATLARQWVAQHAEVCA